MQRVRMKRVVPIGDLPFPSPEIILDALQRVETLRYTYQSIVVRYDAFWQGETNILVTYNQTIVDKV